MSSALPSVSDVQKVSKKQKQVTKTTHDLLDGLLADLSDARKALSDPSTSESDAFTMLQGKMKANGYLKKITDEQKELYNAVSKLGKALEKCFIADISAACREDSFDRPTLNRVVCEHLYREGHFDLGDGFAREAGVGGAGDLKAPYLVMHSILQAMDKGDLDPALRWAEQHRTSLGSYHHLEFMLRRLQFLRVLEHQGRSAAVAHARTFLSPFAPTHLPDLRRLMGCLLFAGRLGSSPYHDLVSPLRWHEARGEFVRACCALMGQSAESPLLVATSAGASVLPQLLKLVQIMKLDDLRKCTEVPVELELSREYVFHSIFACPVSKEQSSAENPPTLLPCGHVLCRQSVQRIAVRENRPFKCPYCPTEALLSQCRPISFPDAEDELIREYRLISTHKMGERGQGTGTTEDGGEDSEMDPEEEEGGEGMDEEEGGPMMEMQV